MELVQLHYLYTIQILWGQVKQWLDEIDTNSVVSELKALKSKIIIPKCRQITEEKRAVQLQMLKDSPTSEVSWNYIDAPYQK